MKRHGNLFIRIANRDNVELAHKVAKRGKGSRSDVKRFMRDEQKNITMITRLLRTKTFHTAPYRVRTIYEPKKRDIFVLPYSPDRVVQQALINVMEPIWEKTFIADSYSCIKNRGIHLGSRRTFQFTQRNKYFVQFDISKFYPSMSHDILKEIVRYKVKCKDTLWLIDDIIESIGGQTNVPIGNITSQWFGNVYMNELDTFAKYILKIGDYIRYCDDFLIFGDDKEKLHDQADALERFCNERLRLRLSKKNLARTQDGVDFLGYRHFPGFVILRTRTATRFKRTVKKVKRRFEAGTIDAETARSAAASLMGWMQHARCHRLTTSIGLDVLYDTVCSVSRHSKEVCEA